MKRMRAGRARELGGYGAASWAIQKPKVHPALVGVGAGLAAASVGGLVTYYGAKLAGRLAGPLSLLNGVLAGGVIGYLAGTKYAE
jgi:hypothetical protein